MTLLSFTRRAPKAPTSTNWSQQELAEIYRVLHLLQQNGLGVDMDRGTTDKGEPWCVFYDPQGDDVFLHLARIDADFVLVSAPLKIHVKAPRFREAIDQFEKEISSQFERTRQRSGKVVSHPSAQLLFSLVAVFLVVKSKAASAHDEDGVSLDADANPEHNLAKARPIISRMQDVMDNPYVMAAMVGALIATVALPEENPFSFQEERELLKMAQLSSSSQDAADNALAHAAEEFAKEMAQRQDASPSGEIPSAIIANAQQELTKGGEVGLTLAGAVAGDAKVQLSHLLSELDAAQPIQNFNSAFDLNDLQEFYDEHVLASSQKPSQEGDVVSKSSDKDNDDSSNNSLASASSSSALSTRPATTTTASLTEDATSNLVAVTVINNTPDVMALIESYDLTGTPETQSAGPIDLNASTTPLVDYLTDLQPFGLSVTQDSFVGRLTALFGDYEAFSAYNDTNMVFIKDTDIVSSLSGNEISLVDVEMNNGMLVRFVGVRSEIGEFMQNEDPSQIA